MLLRALYSTLMLVVSVSGQRRLTAAEDFVAAKKALGKADEAVKTAESKTSQTKHALVALNEELVVIFAHHKRADESYATTIEHFEHEGKCLEHTEDAPIDGCEQDLDTLKKIADKAKADEEQKLKEIAIQKEFQETAKKELKLAILTRENIAKQVDDAEAAIDDDLDLEAIETGEEGIPGGVGGIDVDDTDFELEEVGVRRAPEKVQKLREVLVADTHARVKKIRAWYAKQKNTARKGVYTEKQMKNIRSRHAKRIKIGRTEIQKYKKAVVKRFEEYRNLFSTRKINKEQWKKVQDWRTRNLEKANEKYKNYRQKVRHNYERVRNRNEDRAENRRRKLDVARENALKSIRDVERAARDRDEKLKASLTNLHDDLLLDEEYGLDDDLDMGI